MATANIQSSIPSKPVVTGISRQDLEVGDVVTVTSTNLGTSYLWTLAYVPEGSTASFSGSTVSQSPGTFTVDVEGSYLIRLQFIDGTGTTEQFVRLRALTSYGQLRLVAAGETPGAIPIPVDITAVGWADDQNYNLNRLLSLTRPAITSVKFDFDHTTGAQTIAPLVIGDVVIKVFVVYTQVFDDAITTIEVGTAADPDRFVTGAGTDATTTNKYEISTLDSISLNDNIIYTPNVGTSTQGSGFILALIHKFYS